MSLYRVTTVPIHHPDGTYEPGDEFTVTNPSVLDAFSDNLEAVDAPEEAEEEVLSDAESDSHSATYTDDAEDDAEESAENASAEPTDEPDASTEQEATDLDVSMLPEGYDSFNVGEVEEWLDTTDLSDDDLEMVLAYEEQHKDRSTVTDDLRERLGE